MKKLSIIILATILTACGGSGSESADIVVPVEVMPIGLWEGEIINEGISFKTIGIIASNGEARFISDDGEQDKIILTFSGSEFTGDIIAYDSDGMLVASGNISGSYSSTSMTGTATVDGIVVSSFSLSISEESKEGASLETIKGNYTTEDFETSLAIDADGLISGSDTDGCQYNGNTSVPDSSVNVYVMSLGVSSCGVFDGEYSGLATYAQVFDDSSQKGLLFQVDNGAYSISEILIK